MSDDYHSYKHQCVRDLAWALGSAPLMQPAVRGCQWFDHDWYRSIAEEAEPWLRRIDRDPEELAALVAAEKDKRLGRYFELLWTYWFEYSRHYDIVASNLQLTRQGRTLGELDLVIHEHESGRNIHIELAVKFYLGVGDTCQASSWHGPGKRDRLDIKMDALLERQSVLTRDAAVSDMRAQSGITVDACAVIMKGRLFYPLMQAAECATPTGSHPAHQRGIWVPFSQIDKLEDLDYIPQIKRGWMAGGAPEPDLKALSRHDIVEAVHLGELRLPLYLTGHRKAEPISRVFVVPEDWSTTL